jgi:hypothetical protein
LRRPREMNETLSSTPKLHRDGQTDFGSRRTVSRRRCGSFCPSWRLLNDIRSGSRSCESSHHIDKDAKQKI